MQSSRTGALSTISLGDFVNKSPSYKDKNYNKQVDFIRSFVVEPEARNSFFSMLSLRLIEHILWQVPNKQIFNMYWTPSFREITDVELAKAEEEVQYDQEEDEYINALVVFEGSDFDPYEEREEFDDYDYDPLSRWYEDNE
jgi:hypothetical protein